MQLEKEKETREAAERCRLLAQRIAEELAPEAAAVLAADEESGALLEKALRRAGIRANSWTAAATAQPELLVVEDPVWVELPARLAEQVLLVCTDATALSAWAEKLAERGYYRDLQWRSRGRAQQAALFNIETFFGWVSDVESFCRALSPATPLSLAKEKRYA